MVESDVLTDALGGEFGPVVGLHRRPAAYRSSVHLEEIDLLLEDGSVVELMLKATGSLTPTPVRSVRPGFIRHPTREAEVYRRILRPVGLPVPRLHAVRVDPAGRGAWMVLERVRGIALWQSGDPGTWQDAARWAANLHVRSGRGELPLSETPLLEMNRGFHRRWLERGLDVASRSDGVRARRALRALSSCYGPVLDALDAAPRTLIHGEFFPSNVLVRQTAGATGRICGVDWESAAIGPCVFDVGALTSGEWSRGDREDLESAYAAQVAGAGWWSPGASEFRRMLEAARVQHAVIQLGWSGDWTPPVEHRWDWAGVIMRYLDGEPV